MRAPKPGQAGSRRWRKYRARERKLQVRHKRRIRQAQHEAAKTVIDWAVQRRIGTLVVGDPRGVLALKAGRRHNKRLRDWRIGYLIRCLKDKAEQAGIRVTLVDERRPVRSAGGGFPNPKAGSSPVRIVVSLGTATWSAAPTSPGVARTEPSPPTRIGFRW
jgi:IS605 OrfB family transposase